MNRRLVISLLAFTLSMWAAQAQSSPITIIRESASGTLSTRADIDIVGGNLQIILTNTSTFDVLVPADVLTAFFFDLVGIGPLTPLSALLSDGSTVVYGTTPADKNVGGEWGYASGLVGAPGGATEGISSTGLGLFGGPNFNGPDLSPPIALNGLNFGILSAGDDSATGNTGVTKDPLIKNSVIFTLSGTGLPTTADALVFKNVSFQYGTSLTEPNNVPEPANLTLLGPGLVLIAAFRRRKTSLIA